MTDQEQIRNQEITTARFCGWTADSNEYELDGGRFTKHFLLRPNGERYDHRGFMSEQSAWDFCTPKFSTDWQAFGSLLTVLADRLYMPRITHTGNKNEWIAEVTNELLVQQYEELTATAATPQLALLAATTKLIESVSSNQETGS